MENTIKVEELNHLINQSPEKVYIIDLMAKEEYDNNHIPGAVNIPVEELSSHLSEIPKDKTVVFACRMGLKKSDMALEQLQNAGFNNAKKVEGGTACWTDYKNSN